MGRKKSRRVAIKRRKNTVQSKKFDCPKCNHENVVSCKIFKNIGAGEASCSVCESNYKCKINRLDQQIDVYHYWLDEVMQNK